MNLETKITIYKFTPQLFTLTRKRKWLDKSSNEIFSYDWDLSEFGLSGNFWLLSFKISYLCLPLFYETRTTPSCHPSGCAYRQL